MQDEFGTGGKDKKNPTGGGKGKDKGGKQKQQKYKVPSIVKEFLLLRLKISSCSVYQHNFVKATDCDKV